jgi:FMN phosphatase YigB (HAD superfamily)
MGVAAADAWYVGDTPAFDVVGARNTGLRPFLVDPFQMHLADDCDRVASLSEVAALIRD